VFGLELQLLDAMNDRPPFFRRTYQQDVPLGDRSPDALARGLTEALRLVLVDVSKDLATVERSRKGSIQ